MCRREVGSVGIGRGQAARAHLALSEAIERRLALALRAVTVDVGSRDALVGKLAA